MLSKATSIRLWCLAALATSTYCINSTSPTSIGNDVKALTGEFNETFAQVAVKWAAATYCCGTLGHGCDDWSCPSCDGDMQTVVVSSVGTDSNGFVGYDVDTNVIVVAFAGTNPLSIRTWIDDIDIVKVDYPACEGVVEGCQVHQGFYNSYNAVRDDVRSAVASFSADHPSAKLYVTGHSLGAAMAQLAALDLSDQGFLVDALYNFGQPRTGNEAFSNYFNMKSINTARITHHHDPVPHLPFESWGFHHEPTEVYYNEFSTSYTVCDGSGEDPDCSDANLVDINLVDHLTYMKFDFTTNYLKCEL